MGTQWMRMGSLLVSEFVGFTCSSPFPKAQSLSAYRLLYISLFFEWQCHELLSEREGDNFVCFTSRIPYQSQSCTYFTVHWDIPMSHHKKEPDLLFLWCRCRRSAPGMSSSPLCPGVSARRVTAPTLLSLTRPSKPSSPHLVCLVTKLVHSFS